MAGKAGAIRAGRAYVELFADDSRLIRGLRGAEKRLRAFGNQIRNVGLKLLKLAGLFAIPLIIGTAVFARFEEQMANVSTMLDEPIKHMAGFTKTIRDMSGDFGEGTETLAKGLYDILSASIAPAKAIDVLTASVKAAKGGMTDTGIAADAITTILNSYGLSADRATDISDLLFSIVKRGKTTFAELAPAIGMVASSAAAGGVSLEEMGAGLSIMTRSGVRTERAVTALNAIIMGFLKPTSDAAAYAKTLGFSLSSTTIRAEGLAGVFGRISKLPPDAIVKLFPNIRAIRGILPALKNYKGFLQDISVMGGRAGVAEVAYEKMTKTLMHQFRRIKYGALAVFSAVGEALAPAVEKIADKLIKWVGAVRSLIENNKGLIVSIAKIVVVVAAAGVALVALGTGVTLLGVAIGAVISILKGIALMFVGVKLAVLALISPMGLALAGALLLGAGIVGATGVGKKAVKSLGDKFGELKDDVAKSWEGIRDAFRVGDLALVSEIAFLTIQIKWKEMVEALHKAWFEFSQFMGRDAWDGILSAMTAACHQFEIEFDKTSTALRTVWADMVGWHKVGWEDMKHAATKAMAFLKAQYGQISGAEMLGAFEQADRKQLYAVGRILGESWSNIENLQAESLKRQAAVQTRMDGALAKIGQKNLDERAEALAAYLKARSQDEKEYAKLVIALQAAIAKAREAREAQEEAAEKAQGKREADGREGPDFSGLANILDTVKAQVLGTFLHAELLGRQVEATDKQILDAAEESAETLGQIRDRLAGMEGLIYE